MNKFLLQVTGVLTVLLLATFTLVAQSSAKKQFPDVELKFGKGLQVLAADSSMALKIGFRFQSLFNSERSLEDGSDWETNFLIRRARLKFDGWAFNPNFVYKVELALSNRDLSSSSDFDVTILKLYWMPSLSGSFISTLLYGLVKPNYLVTENG